MNIITIAFCLQFLIACWPKTDVNIVKGIAEEAVVDGSGQKTMVSLK